jgi:hypothetical protein
MVTVCNRNWFVNSYVLYQHAWWREYA